MSGNGLFLYFIAAIDREAATRAKLLTMPFASVMADALRNDRTFKDMIVIHNVATGPTGSSGVLIVCRHPEWPDAHRTGFYPDEQTWRNCGDYWLGLVADCKPGPDSLQRETLVSGYDYELGDELIWHAPIIRYPAGNPNLPQTMGVDPSGVFTQSVVKSMSWAWDLACRLWDKYFLGNGGLMPDAMFAAAVECLSINYRLGTHEASLLGQWCPDGSFLIGPTAKQIIEAAIDMPQIQQLLDGDDSKKNQP